MPYKDKERQLQAQSEHYFKNKEAYSERQKIKRATIVKKRRELVDRYKMRCGCSNCGYKDHPAALQLHHLHSKDQEVSQLVRSGPTIQRLKSEIRKCIVLCANCHLIHHHNERNGAG